MARFNSKTLDCQGVGAVEYQKKQQLNSGSEGLPRTSLTFFLASQRRTCNQFEWLHSVQNPNRQFSHRMDLGGAPGGF